MGQNSIPINRANDGQSRSQITTVDFRAPGENDRDAQHDLRHHNSGGRHFPPDTAMSISLDTGYRPSDLSAYARSMLRYTKRQLDAASGSPPPPHLRVAGPAGVKYDSHRSSSRSSSIQHGYRSSLADDTVSTRRNGA